MTMKDVGSFCTGTGSNFKQAKISMQRKAARGILSAPSSSDYKSYHPTLPPSLLFTFIIPGSILHFLSFNQRAAKSRL